MDISPHFKKKHKKNKQIFKNYQDKVHIHTLNGLTSKVNISMHLSKQFTMFYNIDHKDNINQTMKVNVLALQQNIYIRCVLEFSP